MNSRTCLDIDIDIDINTCTCALLEAIGKTGASSGYAKYSHLSSLDKIFTQFIQTADSNMQADTTIYTNI